MSQDEIESSKAPLMEHLIELRSRLMKALGGLFVAFAICGYFSKAILNILLYPFVKVGGETLIYTGPLELFVTQVKIALWAGLFISFPVIAGQIYGFVAPGLYKHERKVFFPYLVATPIMFGLGAAFVYFILPMALQFFIGMQQEAAEGQARIQFLPSAREYLTFIMTLIFAFGIMFQTPVILTLLAHIGVITSDDLREKRRWAVLVAFIVAAVLTPPDPLSQISLAVPCILLYEVTIHVVRFLERRGVTKGKADTADTEA
ncbi:MAG: twin-arginine translocase subunit TatC [Hyphomicrobiaceae bacterium]|nr:twin-arginine translocase subunit TatC [Hyphomicrobiaceae bacterium]